MEHKFSKIRSSLIAHRSSLIAHRSSKKLNPYSRGNYFSAGILRPFILLFFCSLVLWVACDPPEGNDPPESSSDSSSIAEAPPAFQWAGDYIITNSNDLDIVAGNFFANGHYDAGKIYLGTLHVGADRSTSIASIEEDFQNSEAEHRIDFANPSQDPDNPSQNIASTRIAMTDYTLSSEKGNDRGGYTTAGNKIPTAYRRSLHELALQFANPTKGPTIELWIPAGNSDTEAWTVGLTSLLGFTSLLAPATLDVTLTPASGRGAFFIR